MKRPTLGSVFLTVLLDLLGFGLTIPFLAAEARDTFHTSESVATLLGSVYSLMQFLFVPVWGRLSDRVGRRPVMLVSIAATALSMVMLGLGLLFANSVAWLFLARTLGGMATANLGIASAIIADVTTKEDRARGMGLFGAAFGIGFIVGPVVGGVLTQVSILGRQGALPCFVAAGLSLTNLVWAYFGLRESLPKESRSKTASRSLLPLDPATLRKTFALPTVPFAILSNFLVVLAFTHLDQTFAFFCADSFQMTRAHVGYVLAMVGVISALVQGGLVRPLSKRVSDTALILAGVGLQSVSFGLLALSPSLGQAALWVAMGTLAVGNGLTGPAFPSYISKRAPADALGATLGTNQAFSSLGRTLGPAAAGVLYAGVHKTAPYVAAALGMVVALMAATRLTRGKEA